MICMESIRSRSQKIDPLLVTGYSTDSPNPDVSLPLHQFTEPETPGPMSILEWRRAVWFGVQSIHYPSAYEQSSFKRPCQKSHSWMMKGSSSNSDSGDELADKSNISRPLGSPHQPKRKPLSMPLIDLSQPTDADGRPIQFEGGRAKLVSQPKKPVNRVMAAPDIEQRHREAIRRLQAEATEQLVYAEWEASHQRNTSHLDQPKLARIPSRKAPLQKLSDFARRSVTNFSIRTNVVNSPPRTVTSGGNTHIIDKPKPITFREAQASKSRTSFTSMIKKIGSIKRPSKTPKLFTQESEASMSRKSLLSSFRFSASTSAFHP